MRIGWFEIRFSFDATKIECACEICSKKYYLPKSKAHRYKTCGSDECKLKRRKYTSAARVRECKTCGNTFVPRQTQLNAGQGIFCSQKCNTHASLALHSIESQAKGRVSWKKRNEINPIFKSGKEHPSWKGGKKAAYERARNSGKTRIYCANRQRALNGGKLPSNILKVLGDKQRWKCVICYCSIKIKKHLDHIYPVSKGGENTIYNVQLLCPKCNMNKKAKDPIDYMQSLGRLL